MNAGIELLIARMDLHPEEFERNKDKWEGLFNHFKKYLSEEDKQAFWNKLCELRNKEFTGKVLEQITMEDNHNEWVKQLASNPQPINQIVNDSLSQIFKDTYEDYMSNANKSWKWVTDKGSK